MLKNKKMYLTRSQVQTLLNTLFFSTPFTENCIEYSMYRGRKDVIVWTVRFNFVETVDVFFIVGQLSLLLEDIFKPGCHILGSVQYDLLLRDPQAESYYIWRANSNQNTFDAAVETVFTLNQNNIYRLVQQAVPVNVSDLSVNFNHSNVIIDRPLSVVFSFIQM